ncbi:citrate synthase [Saitoella coloradoensis]
MSTLRTSIRYIHPRAVGHQVRHSSQALRARLEELIPQKAARLQTLKKEYGSHPVQTTTVAQVVGGMRGMKAMLWEGSELDANEGIRFHGLNLEECAEKLPKAKNADGSEGVMLPEAMLWLIMTGEIPTTEQVEGLAKDLAAQAALPEYTLKLLEGGLPSSLHPMTQLSIAVASLNHDSKFAQAYEKGVNKKELWKYAYEDSITLLAKLPAIAAGVYKNAYGKGLGARKCAELAAEGGDWTQPLALALSGGEERKGWADCLRLYLALHGDHEGGNVSAHTSHLVGSALADPFLSYSAALNGLAGPLHGLAAQEVLTFVKTMHDALGADASDKDIEGYLWDVLNSGRVIPGYGHGVLRKTDPRFTALAKFGTSSSTLSSDPLFRLVQRLQGIATPVLQKHGKTANPFPNVDSQSGACMQHFGLTEAPMYTVVFGVSRALGCLSQGVWSRGLGLPIERPKSVSLKVLEEGVKGAGAGAGQA